MDWLSLSRRNAKCIDALQPSCMRASIDAHDIRETHLILFTNSNGNGALVASKRSNRYYSQISKFQDRSLVVTDDAPAPTASIAAGYNQ